MRFNTLFFLLILSCVCLALAQVSYDNCCLKYVRSMSPAAQKHAVKYRHQKTDGGCNIPAVIFTMRKGRILCTDPKETWVNELMKKIDERPWKLSDMRHRRHSRRGWGQLPANIGPRSSFCHLLSYKRAMCGFMVVFMVSYGRQLWKPAKKSCSITFAFTLCKYKGQALKVSALCSFWVGLFELNGHRRININAWLEIFQWIHWKYLLLFLAF